MPTGTRCTPPPPRVLGPSGSDTGHPHLCFSKTVPPGLGTILWTFQRTGTHSGSGISQTFVFAWLLHQNASSYFSASSHSNFCHIFIAWCLQTVSLPLCFSSQSSFRVIPFSSDPRKSQRRLSLHWAWAVLTGNILLAALPAWPWTVTPELPNSTMGWSAEYRRTAICVHKRSATRDQISAPCILTGWPWASHLCCLGLHFIVCKTEIKRENVEPSASGPNSVFIIRGKGYWKNSIK